jgi:DNA gyrase subunit A
VDPTATLLTVCENGYGKRTKFEEYRVQSRGGLGIINIRTSGRNGKVVAVKTVRDSDELMLITHDGMVVRIGVGALRAIGRATQGVRLMTLRESTKVVAVAGVAAEAPPGAAPEPAPSAPSPDSPQADPSPDGPQ